MSSLKLLLLSVFLIAGGALLLNDRAAEEVRTETEQSSKLLVSAALVRGLLSISSVSPEGTVSLTRPSPRISWELSNRPGSPLDPGALKDVELALSHLSGDEISAGEGEEGSDAYGLKEPEATLSLSGSTGSETILFGKKHPLTGRRFATVSGRRAVFLVDDRVCSKLFLREEKVLLKEPLQYRLAKVNRVAISQSNAVRMVFSRANASSPWTVSENGRDSSIDDGFFENRLTQLLHARGDIAEAKDLPAEGAASELLTFEISGENTVGAASRLTVRFNRFRDPASDQERTFFAIDEEPRRYFLAGRFFSEFLGEASQFFDRQPLTQACKTMESCGCLEIEHAAGKVAIADAGDGPVLAGSCSEAGGGQSKGWTPEQAAELLGRIRALQVLSYQSRPIPGAEEGDSPLLISWYEHRNASGRLLARVSFGSLLEAAAGGAGKEDGGPALEAPRTGEVTFRDGRKVGAVLSGADYVRLSEIPVPDILVR